MSTTNTTKPPITNSPESVNYVVSLLEQTLAPHNEVRKPAEAQLTNLESTPGYCTILCVCIELSRVKITILNLFYSFSLHFVYLFLYFIYIMNRKLLLHVTPSHLMLAKLQFFLSRMLHISTGDHAQPSIISKNKMMK